jgi:exonuclease III
LDLWAGTTLGGPGQRNNQLKILQWNAGGLNQAKKTELHRTLEDKEIGAFCIFKANVTEETIKYFHFKNYHLNFLPKSQQIASGILTGTRKPLNHIFSIVKKMNDVDKTKIIKLNVWKNENHVKVSGIYNTPQNNPVLSLLDVSK